MFPALYTFYTRALEIYEFEHADGAGRATDLVIQPFVRFISMAFFPVVICAAVLYVLVSYYCSYFRLPLTLLYTVGGYTSLESAGISPDCTSECCAEPSVDGTARLAHSHIPTKSFSPFSCYLLYI